jgi:hypothetical protein
MNGVCAATKIALIATRPTVESRAYQQYIERLPCVSPKYQVPTMTPTTVSLPVMALSCGSGMGALALLSGG